MGSYRADNAISKEAEGTGGRFADGDLQRSITPRDELMTTFKRELPR